MGRTIPAWLGILLLSISFLVLTGSLEGQQNAALVIEGGTLIDGNGGAPLEDAVIVIQGNQIQTVGRNGSVSYPSGSRVIQADGKFIVPGLMDAHVHYRGWMAELMLNHGVTSVFEIGGGGRVGLLNREAINRGKISGPRVFVAVGSLAGARIAAVAGNTGLEGPLSGRQVIETADAARSATRRFIDAGADMIKVHRGPPVEVYETAAEEAHRVGLPVVAQPLGPTVYAREAVLAGADILEHAAGVGFSIVRDPSKWADWGGIEQHSLDPTIYVDMDETKAAELIQLMVDRNVYLEPDFVCKGRGLFTSPEKAQEYELQDYRLLNDPALAYLPRERIMKWRKIYREFDDWTPAERARRQQGLLNKMRFIRQFADAGGKVMAGTDTSSWAVAGIGLHHELDMMVLAGFSPMEVIVAATRTVAEGFRILDQVGTIEPGKFADLVIVNEDPLADINNLQKIEWVVKDGSVVDRTYHVEFKAPFTTGGVQWLGWALALKQQTLQTDPTWAFGWPPPGILSMSPVQVTEGDEGVTVKLGGTHFVKPSLVLFDGQPVPTRFISETELEATIDADKIVRAGTYAITVKNPEPIQRAEWGGGTSNPANLLVNFRY